MKRIVIIGLSLFLAFLIPAGILNAQEKMNEKRIKIVVTDKSGSKIEIDTILQEGCEGGNVIILKDGKHIIEGKGSKVVTWSASEGDSEGAKYIYINESKNSDKEIEKTINVKVTTDDKDRLVKTKYVIAKDGMVVTIEGNDEAKVKEMIKDIESKLGVSKGEKNMKPVAKEETKKTTKK
ncbi:MAG: hypothetical protein C0408_02850 [Odoribacter sp.]|nr:hypothetical protein [Odoribacter sp.]